MTKKRLLIVMLVLSAGILSAQNKFAAGLGFSAFGPEVDFDYYNNHLAIEAGVTAQGVMRDVDAMLGSFDIMPKLEVGYVTVDNSDICRFSFGGAYIGEFSFTAADNLQIASLYARVFKNFFDGKLELSLKTYLPFFVLVAGNGYFQPTFLWASLDIAGLSAIVGGLATTISVKYCF